MLILWYANKMTALGFAACQVGGDAEFFGMLPKRVHSAAVRQRIGRGGIMAESGEEAQRERTRRIAGGFFPFWERASMPL